VEFRVDHRLNGSYSLIYTPHSFGVDDKRWLLRVEVSVGIELKAEASLARTLVCQLHLIAHG
jgi:hypothetical protein